MTDKRLTELDQFTGTETWYYHPLFRKYHYTEGVQYVAENAGAYWLIEKIFALQHKAKVNKEPFQVWQLHVKENATATLIGDDGNYNRIHHETLSFTDFPSQGIRFYFTDNVLLLPSEY